MTLSAPWAKESRPSDSSPFGKCDCRLDITVPEKLQDAMIAMAALQGMSKSEYARKVLEEHLFGRFAMVQRLANHDRHLNPVNS